MSVPQITELSDGWNRVILKGRIIRNYGPDIKDYYAYGRLYQ